MTKLELLKELEAVPDDAVLHVYDDEFDVVSPVSAVSRAACEVDGDKIRRVFTLTKHPVTLWVID